MDAKLLANRTALVTGAAGAIGKATAAAFAANGAKVCLTDIDAKRLRLAADELKARFGADRIAEAVADVRCSAQVKACVAQALAAFGTVDILVNNAAVTLVRAIDELEDDDIDRIIDTNLKGYFYFTREVVGAMKKEARGGVILMISSKNGLEGASEKTLYSATKGGEIVLARALARELGPFGIRVNTICPDAVHEGSKLWEPGGHYSVATAKRYNIKEADIPEFYRQRTALKVNIKPDDVANAAVFLASDNARVITGTILTVDGGVAFVR